MAAKNGDLYLSYLRIEEEANNRYLSLELEHNQGKNNSIAPMVLYHTILLRIRLKYTTRAPKVVSGRDVVRKIAITILLL